MMTTENTQKNPIDHEIEFFHRLCGELSKGDVNLPTLPDIALRIKRVLSDPDCSTDKVCRVISTEPIVSACLIKLANSAAFAPSAQPVTALKAAITRVGYDVARNTAVSIAIKNTFDPSKAKNLQLHLKQLWKHSLKVAAIAYVLPNKPKHISPDEAMLAGLVHDIGKFYILMRADSNPTLFENKAMLDELTTLWHAGIGKVILEAWGFTEEIIHATDEHEIIDDKSNRAANLTDVVIASNLLSHIGKASPYSDIDYSALPSFKRLGLDAEHIAKIMTQSKTQINSMIQALS